MAAILAVQILSFVFQVYFYFVVEKDLLDRLMAKSLSEYKMTTKKPEKKIQLRYMDDEDFYLKEQQEELKKAEKNTLYHVTT